MKVFNKNSLLVAALMMVFQLGFAQFDNLYYVPGKYKETRNVASATANQPQQGRTYYEDESYLYSDEFDQNNDFAYMGGSHFDDMSFEYYDSYEMPFTARINRFHRPATFYNYNYGMGWYDPWYSPWMDPWNRGPMVNVFIGSGWGWNRWNRWNSWGMGWNSWGMGPGWAMGPSWGMGWNSWGMGWNSWGMGPGWGYNRWNTWGGGWCPTNNYFVNNNTFVNNNNNYNSNWVNNNNVVYGSRRSGSAATSTRGRVDTPRSVDASPRGGAAALTDADNMRGRGDAGTTALTGKDTDPRSMARGAAQTSDLATGTGRETMSSSAREGVMQGNDMRNSSRTSDGTRSSIYNRSTPTQRTDTRSSQSSSTNRSTAPSSRSTTPSTRSSGTTRSGGSSMRSGGNNPGSSMRSSGSTPRSSGSSMQSGSSMRSSGSSSRSSGSSIQSGSSMRSSGSSSGSSMRSSGSSGGSMRSSGSSSGGSMRSSGSSGSSRRGG
jgi:hypothetical protein